MKPLSQSLPLIFPGATLSLAFTRAIFTVCFSLNCVLHSCWLHLSRSPQGGHISGFIWLQWNLGGHADGCFLSQRKLVLAAVITKWVHVHDVVSVVKINLIAHYRKVKNRKTY